MLHDSPQIPARILILTTAYAPLIGGSELAIAHLVRHMPDFEFDIVTARFDTSAPVEERIGNATIHRAGSSLSLTRLGVPKVFLPVVLFFEAWRLHRQHHYQIIHAYQASQGAGAAWLLKIFFPSLFFILTIQEGKVLEQQNGLIKFFRKLLIKKADQVTVISRYLAEHVTKVDSRVPVVLIPNGVDVARLNPGQFSDTQRTELKEKLGIAAEDRVIMTVGRLVEKNGVPDLMRAFALLPDTHAKLVIVGGVPRGVSDAISQSVLLVLAEQLGISERINFTGEVSHERIPLYLSIADVFVRPSLSEGFGSAFLEAMAAKVAVVGTVVGGVGDFLINEQTGLVCPVGEPEALAQVLQRVLGDSVLRDRIILQAHEAVVQKYDWNIIARSMTSLYHQHLV